VRIPCDGFEFEFPDAVNGFIFDQQNSAHPTFHGLSHAMKAVDMVVELEECYLFIEVKDFRNDVDLKTGDGFNKLKSALKYKFRDTFVYRWAEGITEKPIRYLCLLSLDDALTTRLASDLKHELPCGRPVSRWNRDMALSCVVLNLEAWNRNFPGWPASRCDNS
jgi:hypothetical protein